MHHSNIVWAEYMIYISWIHIITAQSFMEVLKIAVEKADHEFPSKDLHLVNMCEPTPFISSSMGTLLLLQMVKLRSLAWMAGIILWGWCQGQHLPGEIMGNSLLLKNAYGLSTIAATAMQTAGKILGKLSCKLSADFPNIFLPVPSWQESLSSLRRLKLPPLHL